MSDWTGEQGKNRNNNRTQGQVYMHLTLRGISRIFLGVVCHILGFDRDVLLH